MNVSGRRKGEPNKTRSMASVSGRQDLQSVGSDSEIDFACDPCAEEGNRVDAYGFCSDCNHYLCQNCYSIHCRPIPMRNHKLLDKNEIPRIRPQQNPGSKTIIDEKCDVHTGKVVEYFCGNHDTTGCTVCMTLNHKQCDSVQYVPDINADNNKIQVIMEQLSELNSKAKDNQIIMKQRLAQANESFDNVLQKAADFSEKTKDFIDRLKDDFEITIKSKRDSVAKMGNIAIESMQNTVQQTDSLSKELNCIESSQREANVFLAMKKAEKVIANNTIENDMEACNSDKDCIFEPNEDLSNLQDRIKFLGIIQPLSRQKQDKISIPKKVIIENKLPNLFRAYSKDDTSDSIIVGIVLLTEPVRTIVADAGNNKIKVIKAYSNTFTGSLQLSSKPFAMTRFSTSKVCVTTPEQMKIIIVSISKLFGRDTIKITKSITCRAKCFGIASYDEEMMIVSEYETGCFAIDVLNTEGLILRHLKCTDKDNEPMFIDVKHNFMYTLDVKHCLLKSISLLNGFERKVLKLEQVLHFTMTKNYLIVVMGSPQVLRVFDHQFEQIDASGELCEEENNIVCVAKYLHDDEFYVGFNTGFVQPLNIRTYI